MSPIGSIRRLLATHAAFDLREEAHLRACRSLAMADGSTSREHYAPGHFTASAFVLSPDRGALLLIHHGKLRRWLQPGGHLEPGDPDLVGAALRELEEESGVREVDVLAPLFDVDVHDIPPIGGHPAHQHFDLRVLLHARTAILRPGSDAEGARWVPLDAIDAVESDASVLRAVAKLRAG